MHDRLIFSGKCVKMGIVVFEKGNTTKPGIPSWQPGMQLFLKLSGWIGGPVLIAAFVGTYLDTKYHTNPWLFLLSVGISFVISTAALIYYGLKEMRRIEADAVKKKDDANN